MKPYKALPPLQTIHNIRSILASLELFTTEYHAGLNGFYHSCRIILSNKGMEAFNIGTNGKGLQTDYALASAYGELMERIQNRMIFKGMFHATSYSTRRLQADYPLFCQYLKENGLELTFRYYPDEKEHRISNWEEFEEQLKEYLPQVYADAGEELSGLKAKEGFSHTLLEAPFYNVNKECIEEIPLQLIRLSAGSTGLCAGNTAEEAILQGIHEIFERYVLQQIYIRHITPPSIPPSEFSGTTIQRLNLLSKTQGLTYEIKDCSLGKGFPVLGLLLIDTRNNSYSFRLGADANPEIALQRCYTEAFQGVNAGKHVFNPIRFEDESIDEKKEFNQNVLNGSGRYPSFLFLDTYSYPHNGLANMSCENDSAELKQVVRYIKESGYRLYIRDNSFLGFPAYHVYIPGLSDVSSRLYSLSDITNRLHDCDFTYDIPLQYRIKRLNHEELGQLYAELRQHPEQKISLFPYFNSPHNSISKNLLLALIAFKLSDLKNAYRHMSLFIEENAQRNIKTERYYYAVRDHFYWANRLSGQTARIQEVLKRLYGEPLAKEVMDDMSKPEDVFRHFNIPDCFHCELCPARRQCGYFEVLELDARIQQRFQQNVPRQEKIRDLFV